MISASASSRLSARSGNRYPGSSSQPPPGPDSAMTGTPAALSASRSR